MSTNNDRRIPGSNVETPHGIEDRRLDQQETCDQFTERARMQMGSGQQTTVQAGIVAGTDPAAAVSGNPLFVETSPNHLLRVKIHAGRAMCEAGFYHDIETIDLVEVASVTVDDVLVLYAEYKTEETTDPELLSVTRAGTVAGTQTTLQANADRIKSVTLAAWLDVAQFPSSLKQYLTVLAVVKVYTNTAGNKTLDVDLTRNTYSWNRPWFSVVDHQHRTKVGTGTVTDNNPHGLGLSDVGAGDMTLLQALLRLGTVVSKDYDVDRVAGLLCKETIDLARRNTDNATGDLTGVPNAMYVKLLDNPIYLGRCWSTDAPAPPDYKDYAPWIMHGTNILVFHPDENLDNEDIEVWYMCAGGSLTIGIVADVIEVTQLDSTREWCITGGEVVTQFTTSELDLRDYRGYPWLIRLFVKKDGSVITLPQVVQCNYEIGNSGAVVTTDVDLIGRSRLVVGLTNVVSPPPATVDVQIQVNGTDKDGNPLSEVFAFDSDWRGPIIPASDTAFGGEGGVNYFRRVGTKLFDTVTSWQVAANDDAGPNASIAVFAMPDWRYATAMRDLCCLGVVLWNGLTAEMAGDSRRVRMNLLDPGERLTTAEIAGRLASRQGIIGTSITDEAAEVDESPTRTTREVLTEDFNRPKYHALQSQRLGAFFSQLKDAATAGDKEVIENFPAFWDRWADGLGRLTFDYPSPANAPAIYVSRAMRIPIEGHYAPYTGQMVIRALRHYIDSIGPDSSANRGSVFSGDYRNASIYVRYGATNLAGDAWTDWQVFSMRGGLNDTRDIDTFWLQLGDPSVDFFSKVQFAIVGGGLRGLNLEFPQVGDLSDQQFEEFIFEVSGDYGDLGGVVADKLPLTYVVNNNRFAISKMRQLREDAPEHYVQAGAWNISGVYLLEFTFDGGALAADDYTITVQPLINNESGGATLQVGDVETHSTAVAKETFAYNPGPINGVAGQAVIQTRANRLIDEVLANLPGELAKQTSSRNNWCRFAVTIRVPIPVV